jgi:3-oxoadipate enol-lactonase
MKLHSFILGSGPKKVIVLHDFFNDTTSYEAIWPYLDTTHFTWAFVDLRGYGRSKTLEGLHTLLEATADVIRVMDVLDWEQAAIVGHSMTGMVAQHLAVTAPDRISKVIGIGPTRAQGFSMDEDTYLNIKKAAQGDVSLTAGILEYITGRRLSLGFCSWMAQRWMETSTKDARLGYLEMFVKSNFEDKARGCKVAMHVMIGDCETAAHSYESVERDFGSLYPNLKIEVLSAASHYPMRETPPYFATRLEAALLNG